MAVRYLDPYSGMQGGLQLVRSPLTQSRAARMQGEVSYSEESSVRHCQTGDNYLESSGRHCQTGDNDLESSGRHCQTGDNDPEPQCSSLETSKPDGHYQTKGVTNHMPQSSLEASAPGQNCKTGDLSLVRISVTDCIDLQEKTRCEDVTYPDIQMAEVEVNFSWSQMNMDMEMDTPSTTVPVQTNQELEKQPQCEFEARPFLDVKKDEMDEEMEADYQDEVENCELEEDNEMEDFDADSYKEEFENSELEEEMDDSVADPDYKEEVENSDWENEDEEGDCSYGDMVENSDSESGQSYVYPAMDNATESTVAARHEAQSDIDNEMVKAAESTHTERDESQGAIYPEIPMVAAESTNAVRDESQGDVNNKVTKAAKKSEFIFARPLERENLLPSDMIQRCVKYPSIFTKKYVKGANEKSKSGRDYGLVHACFYCGKLRTNIQTHLLNVHSLERGIKEIKDLETTKKLRTSDENKKKIEKLISRKQNVLRNKGDNIHNINVCHFKEGELIIARRRGGDFDSSLYGGCPECGEWMVLKDNYTKHRKVCPCDSCLPVSSAVLQMMIFKGEIGSNACQHIIEVFKSIKKDDIGLTAMKDNLIIALGESHFFSNFGNRLKRKNYASFRMRLGTRLLKLLRTDIGNNEASMSDCLVVENFDRFVKCALIACEKNNEDKLKHPSVALKLGDDLNKMVAAKIAFAAKSRNEMDRKEGKRFASVLVREWHLKVKKKATILLQERQFNKNAALPDPEDVAKLAQFLIRSLKSQTYDRDIETFRKVVMLTEARLLLYNRRRPGELSNLEISTYKRRSTSVSETDLSLRDELTPLEQKLLQSQELLEMRGKCDNKIPLLLPEEVKESLKYLTDSNIRDEVGIKDKMFVFASTGAEPIRAGTALDVIKYQAKLKHPERILATNLRKHTATISQVMGLKDSELHWLVNHLGHSEKIHLQNYRATSGMIERIDIAKLMLIQEKNMVGRFAGLKLNEINFEDLDEELMQDTSQTQRTEEMNNSCDEDNFDDLEAEEMSEEMPTEEMKTRKKKPVKRVPWCKEELDEVKIFFKEFLELKSKRKCPGMKDCLAAIAYSKANGGKLCERGWETIKKKVSYLIVSARKTRDQ